jgi:hypothetical protein
MWATVSCETTNLKLSHKGYNEVGIAVKPERCGRSSEVQEKCEMVEAQRNDMIYVSLYVDVSTDSS